MTNRAGNQILGGSDSFASAGKAPRKGTTAGSHAREHGAATYYKMVAVPLVGNTPVIWVVVGNPDYIGVSAPEAINGTAVIAASWQGV